MGFGVGHVWRTTDAGVNWTNISGSLPDAPADSVLVDSADPAHIFAGMDVGIFETRNTGATWTEVGAGLPNVPATRLLLFDGAGVRKLRASTYGRGIWEISLPPVPFFSFQVAPGASPAASVSAGQAATYNLALASNNGFSGAVSLACSGLPSGATCSITPSTASLSSASPNVAVAVTVSTALHASLRPGHLKSWPLVFAALLAGVVGGAARKSRGAVLMVLAICVIGGMTACGGGGSATNKAQANAPATPSSTVLVTATSGNVTHTLSLDLTVR